MWWRTDESPILLPLNQTETLTILFGFIIWRSLPFESKVSWLEFERIVRRSNIRPRFLNTLYLPSSWHRCRKLTMNMGTISLFCLTYCCRWCNTLVVLQASYHCRRCFISNWGTQKFMIANKGKRLECHNFITVVPTIYVYSSW